MLAASRAMLALAPSYPDALQVAGDARVEYGATYARDHASENGGVDTRGEFHGAAGGGREAVLNGLQAFGRQRLGGGDDGADDIPEIE